VNDVKEICDLVLDTPAPPLRDSAEVFDIARRVTRRRNRYRAAGYGIAAVAAATATAVIAAPGVAGTDRRMPATPATAAGARPADRPVPQVPTAQAADAHGRAVARVLTAAVPAGYAASVVDLSPGTDSPSSTWHLRQVPGGYAASTRLVVSAGAGEGELTGMIVADGHEPPAGDVCSTEVSRYVRDHETADFTCETVTVDGIPVRVSTEQVPGAGEVRTATRFLRGGFVMVVSLQGVRPYEPDGAVPPDAANRAKPAERERRPALDTPMLTARQVAAIAADPAMLP
jgi:hypothetical protein